MPLILTNITQHHLPSLKIYIIGRFLSYSSTSSGNESAKVFADGSYRVPGMFAQLYTLYAYIGRKLFPIVYAFIAEKSQAAYEKVLNLIKAQIAETFQFQSGDGVERQPFSFETEFKKKLANAATNVLNCPLKGSLIHFR